MTDNVLHGEVITGVRCNGTFHRYRCLLCPRPRTCLAEICAAESSMRSSQELQSTCHRHTRPLSDPPGLIELEFDGLVSNLLRLRNRLLLLMQTAPGPRTRKMFIGSEITCVSARMLRLGVPQAHAPDFLMMS